MPSIVGHTLGILPSVPLIAEPSWARIGAIRGCRDSAAITARSSFTFTVLAKKGPSDPAVTQVVDISSRLL